MKRWPATIVSLLLALAVFACATPGPPGTGWVTLLDGTSASLDNWNRSGDSANWRSEGGLIVVDKGGKGTSHLVSKQSYQDLQIWAEFWVAENTNSGIFFRITDPKNIGSKSAYEANINDERTDTFGTAAIAGFGKVDPPLKAGGKWNTFLITAKGSSLSVEMNGVPSVKINHSQFPSGPISLQYGGGDNGPIKWRKVMVRPL